MEGIFTYYSKDSNHNIRSEIYMSNKFISAIFNIIEHLIESELTNTSKQLILRYLDTAGTMKHAAKARQVIQRYTQSTIPSLESIREKSKKQG